MSRTAASLSAWALVGALALTGCGAGQIAGTAEQVSAVSGDNSSVGPIAVRNAVIAFGEQVQGDSVYPRGADAPLSMTIVNVGTEADRLVSASSPSAGSVTIAGETEIPGGRVIVVEGATEPLTPTTGVPREASATPATPAPVEGTQVVLTGLLDPIRAGIPYDVTLVFERAGEVRLQVPVGDTEEPREDAPAE